VSVVTCQRDKETAARAAVELVEDGMVVGLGSGSTAACAIRMLGHRCDEGLRLLGVPTSENSRQLALEYGIPLTGLELGQPIDLVIDGADEVDPELNLIKGGGGALLREKIVAAAAKQVVIIVDHAKLVPVLGRFHLPVEFVPFGQGVVARALAHYGVAMSLRAENGEGPFVTDEGNHIYDLAFDTIEDPCGLARQLDSIVGVVEHGLFIDMADRVIVGHGDHADTLWPDVSSKPALPRTPR